VLIITAGMKLGQMFEGSSSQIIYIFCAICDFANICEIGKQRNCELRQEWALI